MNIAIIGTGNVGGALATQWSKAGHHIHLGVRDTANFKGESLLGNKHTAVHPIKEAVALSSIILVASPPEYAESLVAEMGNVAQKVIIDATNAIRTKPPHYPTAFHAFEALTAAEVVKCFNSTGFENMMDPNYGDVQLDMFMAGDSQKGKTVTAQLAQDAGFENCYDFGGSNQVELLEKFALSWINLAIFQGMGRNIGFKLIARPHV